jgi:DNA-binding MarR family transcriptional regulator
MIENAPPSAGEVRAFASQLMAWADKLTNMHRPCHLLADADRHEFVLAQAEAAREAARLRAEMFPDAAFVSPAWRLMLEIFVLEAGGHRALLDQLGERIGLPLLTVLGSVNGLIEKGLVERRDAEGGSRAVQLSMSFIGWQKMTDLMLQCAGHPEMTGTPALSRSELRAAG